MSPGRILCIAQGSFFVGGRQIFSDAAGWDLIGLLGQFSSGDVTVDQMYMEFQIPESSRRHVPIVFVHGCCLSSKTWETTLDGRMGWYEYFTRSGFSTYLAEQSGRARSGFNATIYNDVKEGLQPLSAQPPRPDRHGAVRVERVSLRTELRRRVARRAISHG